MSKAVMAKRGIPGILLESKIFEKPVPYKNFEITPLIRREASALKLYFIRIKSLI